VGTLRSDGRPRSDADRGHIERRLGLLVGNDLEGAHHADAHRLADPRLVGEPLDVLVEDRAQPLGVTEQVDLVVDRSGCAVSPMAAAHA
jgi:hypothetical protein